MTTLVQRFDEAASRNPDQIISFPSEGERLTYRELADTSLRMAGGLAAAGADAGSTIGVLSPNGTAFLQGVLAAGRLGAAACPLPLPWACATSKGTSAGLRPLWTVRT